MARIAPQDGPNQTAKRAESQCESARLALQPHRNTPAGRLCGGKGTMLK